MMTVSNYHFRLVRLGHQTRNVQLFTSHPINGTYNNLANAPGWQVAVSGAVPVPLEPGQPVHNEILMVWASGLQPGTVHNPELIYL
jgi:hypothetical protein